MRKLSALLIVALLCVSCAQGQREPLKWPVTLVGIEGFSEDQQTRVLDAIDELNAEVSQTLVVHGTHARGGSPVTIRWAKEIPQMASTIAGRAFLDSEKCTIQLADVVAKSDSLLKPVLWHELGHCAGLQHDPSEGEIMFRRTDYMENYDNSALSRFFARIQEAAGL